MSLHNLLADIPVAILSLGDLVKPVNGRVGAVEDRHRILHSRQVGAANVVPFVEHHFHSEWPQFGVGFNPRQHLPLSRDLRLAQPRPDKLERFQ